MRIHASARPKERASAGDVLHVSDRIGITHSKATVLYPGSRMTSERDVCVGGQDCTFPKNRRRFVPSFPPSASPNARFTNAPL
jgi:hypothetical protein